MTTKEREAFEALRDGALEIIAIWEAPLSEEFDLNDLSGPIESVRAALAKAEALEVTHE